MIVPFAKGQAKGQPAQQGPAQAQPSETDMLMALAVMHEQGRFDPDKAGPSSDMQKTQQFLKAMQRLQLDPELRGSKLFPSGPTSRPMVPGETLPNPRQFGPVTGT